MALPHAPKIAVLWRGNYATRCDANPGNNRYRRIFEELEALGVSAQPAVFDDHFADEVRQQLLQVDGVLVWANPLYEGRSRAVLDEMLRDVTAAGPWVSAHPDTILAMGTKEVVHRTRNLDWGTDTELYTCFEDFQQRFPVRLNSGAPRVLKQNRGNDGEGVWKVERLASGSDIRVSHAGGDNAPETLSLSDFIKRCAPYFVNGGKMLDQPFQPRLRDGMIRCYLSEDRVVGFGHQHPKGLMAAADMHPDAVLGKVMHEADAPRFQALRRHMESEWVPQLKTTIGLDRGSLPIIWDADFLYGPRQPDGSDSYVLCEINVSSVFAIPDSAAAVIAKQAINRCRRHVSS